MKKLISFLISLTMLMSFVPQTEYVALAEEIQGVQQQNEEDNSIVIDGEEVQEGTLNGVKYIYNSEKVVITGCEDSVIDITIPKEIDSKPVINIASRAFMNNNRLRSVKIEASLMVMMKHLQMSARRCIFIMKL